jgi:1-acyl-sn-glycerol-3-phosphate acyltransferase
MHATFYKIPILRRLFRLARVIPIDSGKHNPTVLRRAMDDISRALKSGELVCLFPEGHLTKTGAIDTFRPGIERIIRRNPVPVIPLALSGLWGSFFSHKGGPAMKRRPKRFWSAIELTAGPFVTPSHATAPELQSRVTALRGSHN